MSLIVADQLLCHLIGDYVLQSDWMANEKTKKSVAALAHAITYGLPFLFLRPSLAAFLLIVGSHFLIDRFRLTSQRTASQMLRMIRAGELPGPLLEFVGSVGLAAMFLYVNYRHFALSSGDFVSFVLSVSRRFE